MEINAVDENNYPLFDGLDGLKQKPMKTAMQELIDELIKESKSIDDNTALVYASICAKINFKYLKKEQEQLEEARLKGYGEGYHEGLYDAENK
jgi:flagellar biosynthesis/type III secretory pathway protein FliH